MRQYSSSRAVIGGGEGCVCYADPHSGYTFQHPLVFKILFCSACRYLFLYAQIIASNQFIILVNLMLTYTIFRHTHKAFFCYKSIDYHCSYSQLNFFFSHSQLRPSSFPPGAADANERQFSKLGNVVNRAGKRQRESCVN